MIKEFVIAAISLFFVQSHCFGQKFDVLDEEDKAKFSQQVQDEIRTLDSRLSRIANSNSLQVQENLIEDLLRNFTETAVVEIGNLSGGKVVKRAEPIKNYLYNTVAKYRSRYSILDIDFVSFVIDDLKSHPTEPGFYIVEYEFTQRFCAVRVGKEISNKEGIVSYDYCDLTTKKGSFLIKQIHTILGSKWKLFYDSIYVEDVTIIDVKRNE